ncbi:MAG: tetratricopeptide repeat protein [Desulfuromusa sp.]|jgi:tetratricopeptide (TPR) repeat protein|nr:tetratricopeptide repeat protein [Desulfuromusa sp.]
MKKQLKRELKQQETKTKTSSRKRWILSVLVVLVLTTSLFLVYRRQQFTAPQRLFAKGIELESLGKISAAEKSYQEIYQNYPQAPEAVEALLRIGKLWQHDHQDEQMALLNYLKLEHDYPDSPLVLPAREEAAQIVKHTLRDYSQAIVLYQRLLDLNMGTPDLYYYEIADCYFRLENYPQARIELETLLATFPHSPLAPDVLYRKGGILLLEGRAEDAQQDWQSLIEQYPDSKYRIQAEFDLAKLLEEEEHLTEALQRYRQLEGFSQPLLLKEKIKHLERRIAEKKEAI